jgi:hypothetical protein
MEHRFTAIIERSGDMDAAYVVVPYDLRREFGKGRLKVNATFNGVPYSGSIVNMGVKDDEGNICYILGVTKAVRKQIGKTFGDEIEVTFTPV